MFKATSATRSRPAPRQQEIAEVIWQMSMLGGLPAMARAMEMVEGVFAKRRTRRMIVPSPSTSSPSSVIVAGLVTVLARNPVHSVLWLILAFLSAAGLFVLMGAEFVAMLLVIVYVGAVAVLFLFVVMMLDVDFAELKAEMARYMPLALLIGVVMLMQLGMAYGVWTSSTAAGDCARRRSPLNVHNTAALGLLLYTAISCCSSSPA